MLAHELADLIQIRSEEIVNSWMSAVRNDPRIHSDSALSSSGLRDHIPAIVEEICQFLRGSEMPSAGNTQEGRVHTYVRYRQGYRGRDLVCELSLLRLILLNNIAEHLMDEGCELKHFVKASQTINVYIDEELRYAISLYTEADKEVQP